MEPIAYDIKKVSRLMRSKGVNVLIASTPENVFYTSGMPVRHIENNPILYVLGNQYPSLVVIKQDGDEALISWQLFSSTPIASWIKDVRGCMSVDDALNSLVALVQESKLSSGETIGIESRMPYYQYEHLAKQFPKTKIRVSDDVFIEMRLEKSEEEIRRIRESTRITEKAIEAMINIVGEGVSDTEFIKTAKLKIIEEGGMGADHVTLGIGSSDPEYPGTGVRMKKGDLARFDVGTIYQGYSSDVSRHASIGDPREDLKEASDFMVELQQVCVDAMKAGAKPLQAYKVTETAHKKSGKDMPFFLTIHSIGLLTEEYHFYDAMRGASPLSFSKNNVVDIEIWTLSSDQGLLGMEDTYLITGSGCERISTLDRKIYAVG